MVFVDFIVIFAKTITRTLYYMDKRSEYSCYKVHKDTVRLLQDIKTALEAFNDGQELSNDEVIVKLVEVACNGDAGFDKVYTRVISDREKLLKLAASEKKK